MLASTWSHENLLFKPSKSGFKFLLTYISSKGDDIQKLSVLSSLLDLAQSDKSGVFNKLLPKVQAVRKK